MSELQTLISSLNDAGLDAVLPTLEDEELTLEVLKEMTADEADWHSSMEELGIDSAAAGRLYTALQSGGGSAVDVSDRPAPAPTAAAPARVPAAAAAPEASLVPPPPEMPDEDNVGLVGRRVLISGLVSRKELNGLCGTVFHHDSATGRYTVSTETNDEKQSAASVTVALKLINIDAEAAKAIPSKKKPAGPGVYVDHAAADAAARVAAEIAAKEKAEVWTRATNPSNCTPRLVAPHAYD